MAPEGAPTGPETETLESCTRARADPGYWGTSWGYTEVKDGNYGPRDDDGYSTGTGGSEWYCVDSESTGEENCGTN